MGICRGAWGSRACVICPSNGGGNPKPSDLPPITPSGRPVDSHLPPSQGARGEAPLGVPPQEFRQTGSATSHPRPPGSPQSGFSISRKGNFRAPENLWRHFDSESLGGGLHGFFVPSSDG